MKSWNELTRLEQYEITYSDMYKDAYGFRPQFGGVMTLEQYEAAFDRMQRMIEENEKARVEQEALAADEFERRVQELLSCGAKSRKMALRWIHEAEGTDGDESYLCYTLGLPYDYFTKNGVQ